MRILILGGSGFVGLPLAESLLAQGHAVTATSRSGRDGPLREQDMSYARWDGVDSGQLAPLLTACDAVINLVGENIGGGRWTPPRQQRIVQSRCFAGESLVRALTLLRAEKKALPRTLLQASACGYYGLWEDADTAPLCTETSPQGQGFLAETCAAWEKSTELVDDFGVRRCIVRLAPVLGRVFSPACTYPCGPAGGFLARMLPPFRYYLGGPAGSGKQPFSWVHMDDVCGMLHLLLQREDAHGIYNVCSPYPETMDHFAVALGHVLRRPSLLYAPAPVLRLVFGQMAEELILSGQKVVPQRIEELGYIFRYPRVDMALRQVLESAA